MKFFSFCHFLCDYLNFCCFSEYWRFYALLLFLHQIGFYGCFFEEHKKKEKN